MLEEFAKKYIELYPNAAASLIEKQPKEVALGYLADSKELALLIPYITPHLNSILLDHLSEDRVKEILQAIPTAVSVQALRHVNPEKRDSIVAGLSGERATMIRLLLSFGPGTAASVMDSTVTPVTDKETVGGCLKHLKSALHKSIYYLYIIDADHRIRGVLNLKELLNASDDPNKPITDIMVEDVSTVVADTPLDTLPRHPALQKFHALPVVDRQRRYLGVIRHEVVKSIETAKETKGVEMDLHQTGAALGELYSLGLSALLGGIGTSASSIGEQHR